MEPLIARTHPLRILIIDTDIGARRAAALVIEHEIDLAVIGEGSDGVDAVVLIDRLHPDVVVIDTELPGMAATEVTATITEGWPSVAVVGLLPSDVDTSIGEMMRCGALGTLKKSEIHKLPIVIRRAWELLEEIRPGS